MSLFVAVQGAAVFMLTTCHVVKERYYKDRNSLWTSCSQNLNVRVSGNISHRPLTAKDRVGFVVDKVALGFLSPSRHVPWQYLKLGHKPFLPHPFQFSINSLSYLLTSHARGTGSVLISLSEVWSRFCTEA
jgi:hypothetical protein